MINSQLEKKQFCRDLKFKDQVNSTFLVKYISLMAARDGRSYLNLILADATGEVECRIWQDAEDIINLITKSDFVEAVGKINLYQGRNQFIVQKIKKVNGDALNREEYILKSEIPGDEMLQSLISIVEELSDVYIRDLLLNILNDQTIATRLKTWPAAKSIHHAYEGGLLEHTLSCCQLGVTLSNHYDLNKNFVIGGLVLHDIGKIYELSGGLSTEYTDEGKLVGHLIRATEIVEKFSLRQKNFPYQTKLHLKHIILSHHGEFAFASPKLPQTLEANLVHFIDLIDSKINGCLTVIKQDNMSGKWTSYAKHLDRILYKGDLPHHSEYLQVDDKKPLASRPKNFDTGLKQNLGKLLSNVKVDK